MTVPGGCDRAVGILEGSNDVRDALMAPLRHMTALQVTPQGTSCTLHL